MKSALVFVRSSFQTFMLKKGVALHLYSKGVATPSLPPCALSLLSAVYINSPSRSRCQPIKYIHFPGFYSAAHLLSAYEWRPLNSFQFIFKAGFIGTTVAQWANCASIDRVLLHLHVYQLLLHGKKALFVSWRQQTVETVRESRRQFGLSLHEQNLKLKVQPSTPPLPTPLLHHLLLFLLSLPFSVACSLLWMGASGETLEETAAPSCFH